MRRILLVVLLLAIPAATRAQTAEQMEKMMKAGQPGEMHKLLGRLAGTWEVKIHFKLGGAEHDATASCESKWVLDGRFLQQEYRSNLMGSPFTVLQYLGYDNLKERFVEIKMDSMDTAVMHNEGELSKDGKSISNLGDAVDPNTGKPGKLRTVTTFIDADHYAVEWFRVGAGGEEKVVTLAHTRKT